MKKYIYAFYFLGSILFILSISNFIGSWMNAVELLSTNQNPELGISKWKYLHFLSFSFHQMIYPIVLSILCLFLAKIAKLFDGPDATQSISKLIKNLRTAGDKTDG